MSSRRKSQLRAAAEIAGNAALAVVVIPLVAVVVILLATGLLDSLIRAAFGLGAEARKSLPLARDYD